MPGDKSISHRALLFGAMARGTTRIRGLLRSDDVHRTLDAVRALGCDASGEHVTGSRWNDGAEIDCGNSGTTARLLLGALAPRADATLRGDASLSRRPMRRVTSALAPMGASFSEGGTLPMTVRARSLIGVDSIATVASAQVKSAVLLAGLGAEGTTRYTEPVATRDHSERLLSAMGATLSIEGGTIALRGGALEAIVIDVPGDLSSAAFWMVAAAITPGSDLLLEGVGLNPTRTGLLDVLARMGAVVEVDVRAGPEPLGTVRVRGGELSGAAVGGAEIPRLIDEIPILAIAAAFATGETVIRDAAELRVKESDRIATVIAGLRAMGVDAEALPDGMRIRGGGARAAAVESAGDHRIAMAFAIAGLRVGATVNDTDCIATSYPDFTATLARFR